MSKDKRGGAVAAGHVATAQAAAEILDAGGNAFDAALAGMLAACVPEAVLASLGGGGFLMALPAGHRQAMLYDFFCTTPAQMRAPAEMDFRAIHADFGPATQEFHIGAAATAVPGVPAGICAVHAELGRLPLTRIIAPACRLARQGVAMSPFQAYLFEVIAPILTASPAASALFASSGTLLKAGETFRNPNFADTLEMLAADEIDFGRNGAFANALIEQQLAQGGHLRAGDLINYRVERREPLQINFHGGQVALNPAPSAGGPLVAFGLALEQQLDGNAGDGTHAAIAPDQQAVLRNLALQEATNAARTRSDWNTSQISELVRQHLHDLKGTTPAYRGTTHISVIDGDGNAAALTISNGEGNGLILPGLGVMANNMLGEEDLNPRGFHHWPPAARLSSMMAPTLLLGSDGAVTALGSGGSNRIRSAILSVLMHIIRDQMPLADAVHAPRLHLEKCGTLSFEAQFSAAEQELLLHRYPGARAWPEPNMFFGGVHAVRRHANGTFEAVGDARRDGCALIV